MNSQTDWQRVDVMTDDEIDTSDIPPLDDKFFARARWRIPRGEMAMESQATSPAETTLQTLIRIVRTLPTERVSQVVDFARFIQLQTLTDTSELDQEETEEEIRASEEKWDQLLARPEAQSVLLAMANEAIEEYRAGRTTEMIFTEDGPGYS